MELCAWQNQLFCRSRNFKRIVCALMVLIIKYSKHYTMKLCKISWVNKHERNDSYKCSSQFSKGTLNTRNWKSSLMKEKYCSTHSFVILKSFCIDGESRKKFFNLFQVGVVGEFRHGYFNKNVWKFFSSSFKSQSRLVVGSISYALVLPDVNKTGR